MPSSCAHAVTVVLVGGLLVGGGAFLYERLSGPARDEPTAEFLARGQQVYEDACAACHGARLEGQANWRQRGPDGLLPAPPHDASGHTWHHPDEQLFAITKYGTAALVGQDYKSAMIGFGDQLSDEEIRAALEFIKSRWPEGVRRRQAEITERASRAD